MAFFSTALTASSTKTPTTSEHVRKSRREATSVASATTTNLRAPRRQFSRPWCRPRPGRGGDAHWREAAEGEHRAQGVALSVAHVRQREGLRLRMGITEHHGGRHCKSVSAHMPTHLRLAAARRRHWRRGARSGGGSGCCCRTATGTPRPPVAPAPAATPLLDA